MKLETFFEKFDLFADAPDAVAKMRELIRNFAVKGKLVSQDPNDEPAEALVARIAAALPDKKSANPFLEEIEDSITDESEYELPPGWAWLPLGHVGIWATGCGFPMQYQGSTNGEFLFCKVSDMNLPGNELEIHTTVHSIDADVLKKIRARVNPVGTVIFPKIGGAIATHKRRLVIKPTIIDNNCSGIQPIGLTDDRWLLLFMRSLDLTKYQSGTSVPAVSQGSLDPIRIGLPPLAEQKRIVAKVDEMMALCDRLEAQQQELETRHASLSRASLARFADAPTSANLNFILHKSYAITPADLRKSILTLAVQGKLVPQDPHDKPAFDLIQNAVYARKQLVAAKVVRDESRDLGFLEQVEAKMPNGWVKAPLSVYVGVMMGQSPPSSSYNKSGQGLPFYQGKAQFGRIYPTATDWCSEPKKIGEPGDVVISVRAPVGPTNMLREKSCIGRGLASLRSLGGDQLHLLYTLRAVERSINALGVGSTFIAISKSDLDDFVIPIPPLAEQRRIVAKVDKLMALVDELEAQIAASRATASNLMKALVAEISPK